MTDFDPVRFVSNHSVEELDSDNITKDNLKFIATTFRVPFTRSTIKDELKSNIEAYLRATDFTTHHCTSTPDLQTTLDIETVKLQALQVKLQTELAERESMRLKHEHELKVLQLKQSIPDTEALVKFDVAKHVKLLPIFSEENPEAFFRQFETTAEHFKWPKEHWVWLLKPKLVEFAAEKLRSFNNWIKSASVHTFEGLVNLLILEEFKRKVPYYIMVHITNREETDYLKAAKLADVSLIHRPQQGEGKTTPSTVRSHAGSTHAKHVSGQGQLGEKYAQVCRSCKKGHHIKDCPDPRCKVSKGTTATSTTFTKPVATINLQDSPTSIDLFQPFRSPGTVSLGPGKQQHPVQIIRDTASAQSLIHKASLPDIESNLTGEKVYLKLVNASTPVHFVKIKLDCEAVKGTVTVGVVDTPLPIPDATFLLGNDLAGSLVVPALTIRDTPLPYSPTEDIEKEQPTLFPICAVTRSQHRRTVDEEDPTPPLFPKPCNEGFTTCGLDVPPLNKLISEHKLEEAQRQDPTLTKLHQEVLPKEDILDTPAFYYQDNILMRFYSSPKLSDEDTWAETHQVVVPQCIRQPLMKIAHEGFSGHLGINKTYLKLLNDFYWPGMKKDIVSFNSSCLTCQIVGKPNQSIPSYPLQPIPVPSEPFQKIIIDIVGPLPKSKKGNQYILTVLGPTSRYPEAFPLKTISAKNVANKLIHMFTTFGIPQEVRSDRGTNFTSDLFKDVLQELGIKQTLSTAHHPQSQGALERHHQTLKSMIRKYCHERNQDWDEGLPFLLFAVRESPHESLGCSPFELVFGRQVRGPLKVVKDELISHKVPLKSFITYLQQLKDNLDKIRKFARDNMKISQHTMKSVFDVKAKDPARDQIGLPCNVMGSQVDNTLDTSDTTNNWKGHSNSDILQDLSKFLAHLQPEQVREVSSVLLSHSSVISDTPGHCTIMSHDVVLIPGTNPISQPPYRIPHQKRGQMKKEVDYLLDNNLAVPSCSPWASPCLLVPKEDGQLRLCTDYRRLNSVTQSDAYPLPRIDDLIDMVGQSKYISKIDLNKGFYQIPLTENAQTVSAFITPFELYEYRVMPFGKRNSPGTFQRTMNFLFQDLDKVEVYFDDITVYSDTWYNHMHRLSAVLRKLQDAHLTIKPAKSTFCSAQVTYLGHEVGKGNVRPKSANVSTILSYPTPDTKKSLMRFLGMAGFYRRYCPNFSSVVAPLTRLTSGKVTFKWTEECQEAFNHLKTYLSHAPVLMAPNFAQPFVLQTDASDVAVGAVLLRETNGVMHPIAYHSAKSNKQQILQSTLAEMVALLATVQPPD
ncbi:uncharacterized protein [Panulirus ornatus]|uniref:uncharacterized protein n=1 Tax=Panulirus ornatus TaxID=150431 RepID=UPI003A8BA02E